MEESYGVNAECISCSFKGSIEVKKGKKIYEMSCSECGNKTLKKRGKSRRVKGNE
jgi:transcription elongation factor Elf1